MDRLYHADHRRIGWYTQNLEVAHWIFRTQKKYYCRLKLRERCPGRRLRSRCDRWTKKLLRWICIEHSTSWLSLVKITNVKVPPLALQLRETTAIGANASGMIGLLLQRSDMFEFHSLHTYSWRIHKEKKKSGYVELSIQSVVSWRNYFPINFGNRSNPID